MPKPLSETNPYLRNPETYEKLILINVTSSTAIELGSVSPSIVEALKKNILPTFLRIKRSK